MKKVFIYFVLLFAFLNAEAQQGRFEAAKIITASPNASNLGKYGDYPVNYASGVPQIDIPLYTIKTTRLELPVSISYHASGIKVDEESSFIGLGWTLNAGGVITRVIKDKDDWGSYGFASRYNTIPDLTQNTEEGPGPAEISNSQQLKNEYDFYDKEPDLYMINVNGMSGTFVMDNEGKFISTDLDATIFTVNYISRTIVVTDKYGKEYRFGKSLDGNEAFEESSISYITGSGSVQPIPTTITSWYLTEIISADKTDTIKFTYQLLPISLSLTTNVDRYTFVPTPTAGITDARGTVHEGVSYSQRGGMIPNGRILEKIIFKSGYLEFSTVNDRQDVYYSGENSKQRARISGFSVYEHDNILHKRIVFKNNDHFNRSGTGNAIIPPPYRTPLLGRDKKLKIKWC